jgi:hypothetical protein
LGRVLRRLLHRGRLLLRTVSPPLAVHELDVHVLPVVFTTATRRVDRDRNRRHVGIGHVAAAPATSETRHTANAHAFVEIEGVRNTRGGKEEKEGE